MSRVEGDPHEPTCGSDGCRKTVEALERRAEEQTSTIFSQKQELEAVHLRLDQLDRDYSKEVRQRQLTRIAKLEECLLAWMSVETANDAGLAELQADKLVGHLVPVVTPQEKA